jgi:hypothetical protein
MGKSRAHRYLIQVFVLVLSQKSAEREVGYYADYVNSAPKEARQIVRHVSCFVVGLGSQGFTQHSMEEKKKCLLLLLLLLLH